MAWGYWSASTVQDRGRSPRRSGGGGGGGGPQQPPPESLQQQQQPQQGAEEGSVGSSRRPSLADIEFSGPGGALAHVLCAGLRPPPLPPPQAPPAPPALAVAPPPPPPPLVRHDCFMHQSAALVHHHQCRVHDLSPSDDEDPTYDSVVMTAEKGMPGPVRSNKL
ncbi:hypothetical protein AAG570_003643 [Ranatra chinensis]|uniref:Uncharacterized protein n=1 Tax=Ranatra chinensis TaxID=642074 RepID=A0ABD0Y4A9_9HEMI